MLCSMNSVYKGKFFYCTVVYSKGTFILNENECNICKNKMGASSSNSISIYQQVMAGKVLLKHA